MKKQNGFSMLEIMVSVGILGIVSVGVFKGVNTWRGALTLAKSSSISDGLKTEFIQSFASQAQFMQVDYSSRSAAEILSGDLPMAWNKFGKKIPVSECRPNCPRGRYGVAVKPVTVHKGIYKMTIKVTHEDWPQPKNLSLLIGE